MPGKKGWYRHIEEIGEFPWQQLKVPTVKVRIKESNKPAIKITEKLGFQQEGRLRKAQDGEDVLIYGILKEEWYSNLETILSHFQLK